VVAAERALQVPPFRFAPVGMTKWRWLAEPWRRLFGWRVLRVVAAERALQVPPFRFAPVGMTKWRWLADLGIGYSDGGS
jgi:hypothetical protein